MKTVTIDILDEKALRLLKDLEFLKLIKVRIDQTTETLLPTWNTKYKGAMSKQSISEIESQLKSLRTEWE